MSNLPVDQQSQAQGPVDGLTAYDSLVHPLRQEENSILGAMLLDLPKEELERRIQSGGRTDIRRARNQVEQSQAGSIQSAIEVSVLDSPQAAADLLQNEQAKQSDWNVTGENLFLEQILALEDPNVNAEVARYATNLQIGEEAIREALEEHDDDGVLSKIWDFTDRYILRQLVIGGFEDITRRSERGGREHLDNMLNMDPAEYEKWIRAQVASVKQEGFFTGDNLFALTDELQRMQNSGIDPLAGVWQVLAVADIASLAGLGGKLVKAGTRTRRARAISGAGVADDLNETLVRQGNNPVDVNDGMPEMLNPISDTDAAVSLNRTARIREENKLLNEVSHLNETNTFGRGVDSAEVGRAVDELKATLRATTNNPLVGVSRGVVRDATGGMVWDVQLGTVKSGSPFKTEAAAKKAAANVIGEFPTAKAVEAPGGGYYVSVQKRMDLSAYTDELSWKTELGAVSQIVAKFAGSTAATENKHLNTLATMAEGGISNIVGGTRATEISNAITRMSSESQRAVSKVFNELRDGPSAGVRNSYSESDFIEKFKNAHPEGKAPTLQDIEGFHAITELNDAAYMMRAHGRLQKYVSRDYYALELADGTRVPARRVEHSTLKDLVLNGSNSKLVASKDLHRKATVWELDREIGSGVRYVTQPEQIKALDHSDVLGYNAGGRRVNPDANYFLMSNKNNPRAFLTAFSAEQAAKAMDEIKAIQAAIARGDKNIDEVIRANNTWNPEIQTLDDLNAFQSAKQIDFTSDIFSKNRDGEIATGEVRDGFSETWDDYVTFGHSRSDEVLTAFGGGETRNKDAVAAIFDDFGSIAHQYAYNTYTESALNSWVKSARRTGSGWDVGPEVDARRAFENATFRENTNPAGRELATQHAVIKRRLGIKSEAFRAMESYGASMQEYVFGKTGAKLPRDPVAGASQNLLNIGFHSAFGFGNISQFFVQGYHALTIAALTQNSMTSFGSGMKAITMVPALRMALFSPNSAAEKLAVRRLAKHMALETNEVEDILDYIRTSGRDIIDGSTMEAGTGQAFGIGGWKGESYLPSAVQDVKRATMKAGGRVFRAGLIPFNEGERAARLTGITTAILEYQAKFPRQGIKSTHARQWITDREQALTFRMTNANRAFMQQGFGKLPTQWFTYTLRTMENVVIGRDFTAGERARMFAFLFPAFGLTGMGAASATDWVAEKIGVEPAGHMYSLIKFGMVDAGVEALTGQELAMAERLAPITLIHDVYKNIEGAKSPWQVALGPSGDITGGILEQTMNLTGSIINGTPVMMTEDAIRILRQASGLDNIAKAMGIMNNGLYRSRTGTELPFELTTSDAIGQLLGFSPREVTEWYQEKAWKYNTDIDVRNYTRQMNSMYTEAMQKINGDDPERGYKLLEEINIRITMSGMSPIDQAAVRRGMRVTTSRELIQLQLNRSRREDHYASERIEESFDVIGSNQ